MNWFCYRKKDQWLFKSRCYIFLICLYSHFPVTSIYLKWDMVLREKRKQNLTNWSYQAASGSHILIKSEMMMKISHEINPMAIHSTNSNKQSSCFCLSNGCHYTIAVQQHLNLIYAKCTSCCLLFIFNNNLTLDGFRCFHPSDRLN